MKKISRIAASIMAAASVIMTSVPVYADDNTTGSGSESRNDIVVLYTNDAHCAYKQAFDKEDTTKLTCEGYAALAKYKKDKEENSYVELVDAGDAIQGDVIGTLSNGEYIADIMAKTGYTIAVPGNHEFDYGMDNFLALTEKAGYDYISCNFMDLASGESVLPAYEMKEYGDKKVAYVGISTPETFTKSTPTYFQDKDGNYIYGFCEGNDGADLYNQVQKTVDKAKADGADYVVAIGHTGIDPSSTPWTSGEIIANTTGINAYIDGHSHSTIEGEQVKNKEGKDVLLTSTGTKLAAFGELTISSDGVFSSRLVSDYTEEDPEVAAYVEEIEGKFKDLQNQVVAATEVDLTVNDPATGKRMVRNQETNLGDLCADAYRDMLGADVAFVNGGGVRADIKTGDITYGDIIKVHPFGNAACLIEATGQQILDALELGSSAAGYDAENDAYPESGGFLQVSGLTYEIDTTVKSSVVLDDKKNFVKVDGERRVKNVKIGGKAIDPAATYKLASHNYMLKSGGDGYSMFKGDKVLQDEVMIDNQVLINYITKTLGGKVTKDSIYANPYGDGRIKVILDKAEPTYTSEGYEVTLRGFEQVKETFPKLASTPSWKKDSKGWWYDNGDGTYAKNQWMLIGGKYYFFDNYGYMKTGWAISGDNWYFLYKTTGAMKTGWVLDGGKWYFLDKYGAMKTGWVVDGSKWYFLDKYGAMKTGWVLDGGKWYFLDKASGAMKTGWVLDGGKWYYLDKSGAMVSNTWVGGYYLQKDGSMRA